MTEDEIRRFWQAHPCGEQLIPDTGGDLETFFTRYDAYRYATEMHIPRCLDQIEFRDKRVLEIGLGQGAESEQIIRRGARWHGIDLTDESVQRVRARLSVRALPYERLERGSALALPFEDGAFDIVFSHGVLHHIPDVRTAQSEIARVLAPDGTLVAMVYAKRSLNYLVSIAILRRLGLVALYPLFCAGVRPRSIVGEHLKNARENGLVRYLRTKTFVSRNTDGPFNPYSRVYGRKDVRNAFPAFELVHAHQEFMHAPPLPVARLPASQWLGWHLWVHLRKRPGRT